MSEASQIPMPSAPPKLAEQAGSQPPSGKTQEPPGDPPPSLPQSPAQQLIDSSLKKAYAQRMLAQASVNEQLSAKLQDAAAEAKAGFESRIAALEAGLKNLGEVTAHLGNVVIHGKSPPKGFIEWLRSMLP